MLCLVLWFVFGLLFWLFWFCCLLLVDGLVLLGIVVLGVVVVLVGVVVVGS